MSIIVTGCDKGGGGKTTVALNIAAYLAMEGRDVVLMDADNSRDDEEEDPEGDASGLLALRGQHPELVQIHHAQGVGRIQSAIRSLAARFQDVIIDTGAGDTTELRSALKTAHLAVMPLAPRLFDQWAARRMARLLDDARFDNPGLEGLAVINFATTNWMSRRAEEARELLGQYKQFTVAAGVLYLRDPIELAQHTGRSVFEGGRACHKAADDMAAVMQAIIDKLGTQYRSRLNHG